MNIVRTALAFCTLISLQVVSPLADAQEVGPGQLEGFGFVGDSSVEVQEHIEELVRRISEAAVENPDFLQAMLRYRNAKTTYDEQRSDK